MSLRRLPKKDDVLRHIAQEGGQEGRVFHPREIAPELGVSPPSYEAFANLLDNMVFEGELVALPGGKYKLGRVASSKGGSHREEGGGGWSAARSRGGSGTGEEREGTLTVNQRGFGFVASLGASGDDVFVPKESMKGAMHGDKVVVHVRSRGSRGAEGDIVKIVDRTVKRVAGVLRRRGRSAWLEPDDTRVRGPIPLPDDLDTSGPEGNSGKDGDAAVVKITRWPEMPDENPVGKLEAILGTPGELRVEVAKILVMGGVDEVHSPEAFAEAEAYGKEVPAEMLAGREDLTHLPLPTIDPEDARDHDDAVWVERKEDGGYRAWIAIADVSSYVRPGTQLDAESLKRGCSIYLPDRAIPMLPRPLSSNLCSLLPDVLRLCLCVEVELDSGAKVKRSRVIRGFMKSRAKLTYGGVARALGFTSEPPRDPKAEAMIDGLRVANELSRTLRAQRMKRGALDFDLPEAKIVLDDKGHPIDVQKRAQDPGMKKAYALIEELMLLANETVAEWLVKVMVPTVFRVHAPPDQKKLANLVVMCEALGVPFELEDAEDPKKLSKILRSFAEHPQVNVLNMLLLRSMKQASYDIANIGHFGLASRAYLHFTSPIRRYPDLVVHRSVHDELLGERRHKTTEAATKLGEAALAASSAERKAMEIEREVTDLYRAVLMRDRIGERYEATVTALVGSGLFCQLDAPFVDVLVRLEDLGADRWELDEEKMRVTASRSGQSLGLGDRIAVQIVDVQILRRTVYGRRVTLDPDGGESGESSRGATVEPRRAGAAAVPERSGASEGDEEREGVEERRGAGARRKAKDRGARRRQERGEGTGGRQDEKGRRRRKSQGEERRKARQALGARGCGAPTSSSRPTSFRRGGWTARITRSRATSRETGTRRTSFRLGSRPSSRRSRTCACISPVARGERTRSAAPSSAPAARSRQALRTGAPGREADRERRQLPTAGRGELGPLRPRGRRASDAGGRTSARRTSSRKRPSESRFAARGSSSPIRNGPARILFVTSGSTTRASGSCTSGSTRTTSGRGRRPSWPRFAPSSGWPADRLQALFIGALGDERKGFATLYAAWKSLCRSSDWDVDLVAVGVGRQVETFRERARADGLGARMTFLGFRSDVPQLVGASDLLVAPSVYEPYGLAVHEALSSCAVPAITSARCGVAEMYPDALTGWLLPDPKDDVDLASRLRRWREQARVTPPELRALSDRLRARDWSVVARVTSSRCAKLRAG